LLIVIQPISERWLVFPTADVKLDVRFSNFTQDKLFLATTTTLFLATKKCSDYMGNCT